MTSQLLGTAPDHSTPDAASAEDPLAPARGVINGLLLSLPIWAVIWAAWKHLT